MGYKIGDIRNGLEVLAPEKRKKILLLSDDMRMSSGIATMSKEFVMGLVHQYSFIQLGAAVNHPEKGKQLDLSEDISKSTGVPDPLVHLVPWSGYGDANILRQLMMKYQPDLIIMFTDPRYWKFIWEMESEIRENCPIAYYNIWDDLPLPIYNADYYASCDGLMAISKQTYGINHNVLKKEYDREINLL